MAGSREAVLKRKRHLGASCKTRTGNYFRVQRAVWSHNPGKMLTTMCHLVNSGYFQVGRIWSMHVAAAFCLDLLCVVSIFCLSCPK